MLYLFDLHFHCFLFTHLHFDFELTTNLIQSFYCRLSTQARTILENLMQNNHGNVANILRDRIQACEACELFASKSRDLRAISQEQMDLLVQQILAIARPIEFPLAIQVRLAERYLLCFKAAPCFIEVGQTQFDARKVSLAMSDLARALCPDAVSNWESKFDILKPSFSMVFHGIAESAGLFAAPKHQQDLSAADTSALMMQIAGGSHQLVLLEPSDAADGNDELKNPSAALQGLKLRSQDTSLGPNINKSTSYHHQNVIMS